eukprot:15342758-Ditylum_brightwellii.AAC.1
MEEAANARSGTQSSIYILQLSALEDGGKKGYIHLWLLEPSWVAERYPSGLGYKGGTSTHICKLTVPMKKEMKEVNT